MVYFGQVLFKIAIILFDIKTSGFHFSIDPKNLRATDAIFDLSFSIENIRHFSIDRREFFDVLKRFFQLSAQLILSLTNFSRILAFIY
jgi:hypothetical protein